MPMISDIDRERIIVAGESEILVKCAEKVGKTLSLRHKLTMTQIRNIFGTIRQIEMFWSPPPLIDQFESENSENLEQKKQERIRKAHREFNLLLPRLAYQAKREMNKNKDGVQVLVDELRPLIELVLSEPKDVDKKFQNFVDFFEAVLGYYYANSPEKN